MSSGKQGGSGGGTRAGGSGGKAGTGGTGGAASATGGAMGTGGAASATGGAMGTGGSPPVTGGVSGTGGATGGAGGTKATGGTGGAVTGGTPATGGKAATGGAAATGGVAATGGANQSSGLERRFDFEGSTGGWKDLTGARIAQYTQVTPIVDGARKVHGNSGLKYTFTTQLSDNPRQRVIGVVASEVGEILPGKTIKMSLFLPTGHPIIEVQAFIHPFSGAGCAAGWNADRRTGGQLVANAWAEYSIVIPANWGGCDPLELGFFMVFNANWTGDIWVDNVTLQ